MKVLLLLLFVPLVLSPVFAETQTLPTEKNTLNVKLNHEEIKVGDLTNLQIDFLNPFTKDIQNHVDYEIEIANQNGEIIFKTPNLIHTSEGSIRGLKVEFPENGNYNLNITIEGILFSPIPKELVSFPILVGQASSETQNIETSVSEEPQKIETTVGENKSDKGGGCLIATAAFGSELAPQVQQLRELRDNTILQTDSGKSFMTSFNQFYYTFSPGLADLEREQPIFKEIVKITLTPMLSSLSLLNNVDINSEQEMISYGLSIIFLNVGMYFGLPIFGILKLYQSKRQN
jgi:hypothetical protein